MLGLAVVAAALAGGSYLYLHTSAVPHAEAPEIRQAAPAPAVPGITAPVPGNAQELGNASRSADPILPPQSVGSPTALPVAPFGTSEEVFEAGARLYAANCAGCHGRPGSNGKGPNAAQFWDRNNAAGRHAIAQSAGAIYQATAKGNLAQGMPSYGQRLTDTQVWDLALLLKSAHEDLPDPVLRLLRGGR